MSFRTCEAKRPMHRKRLTKLKSVISFIESIVKGSDKQKNKSTSSRAIYACSSVIFPHRMAFVMGEVDAVKRRRKLNLTKKLGKGGGGVTLQL